MTAPAANAARTPRSSTSTPASTEPAAIPIETAVPNQANDSAAVPGRAERSMS